MSSLETKKYRIAFPEHYDGFFPYGNLPRFHTLQLGEGNAFCWVYSVSQPELELEERFRDGLLTATFSVSPKQDEATKGMIARKVSLGTRHEVNFFRQFGIEPSEDISQSTLDDLLDPGKEISQEWVHQSMYGISCDTNGAAFLDGPTMVSPLQDMGEVDLDQVVSLDANQIPAQEQLLIQSDQQVVFRDLSKKVRLSNGQHIFVIPAFPKGEIETYLDEKTHGTKAQLSMGVFKIERCLSGDVYKSPMYFRISYGRQSRFQVGEDVYEIRYERHSGPLWITPSEEKLPNNIGVETDPIFFDQGGLTYNVNLPEPGSVFSLPASRSQLGSHEFLSILKNGKVIAMGRNFKDNSGNPNEYQLSQHRDLDTLYHGIDQALPNM